MPGQCPGVPGYCSLDLPGGLCTFECARGKHIRSSCLPDGTWDPYPTCEGDVRETKDGCDPCPGPFGGQELSVKSFLRSHNSVQVPGTELLRPGDAEEPNLPPEDAVEEEDLPPGDMLEEVDLLQEVATGAQTEELVR